ncbi:hypothetical protein B0T17DRAFT_409074 [Bombardia bombarda]|uniref:Uncharacterized protein n=1 Tax=Bombardia bombarda TaxID=252184 RepID=A0AA39T2B3_9PEZI|nr:hypothetical protein B0T17DRAFT_409074 [Bombardia bombarda]
MVSIKNNGTSDAVDSGTKQPTSTARQSKIGSKIGSRISGPDSAATNDNVRRFVLLVSLIKRSGLCTPDIKTCLSKYLKNIRHRDFMELRKHMPNVRNLEKPDWQPDLNGLAKLGPGPEGLPAEDVHAALVSARKRLVEDPDWFYGAERGWFLWAATRLSYRFQDNVRHSSFWLGELDAALFISLVARIQTARIGEDFTSLVSPKLQAIYREAWYSVFGLFWSVKHFDQVCVCADKSTVFPTMAEYKGRRVVAHHPNGKAVGDMEDRIVAVLDECGINEELKSPITSIGKLYMVDDATKPHPASKSVFNDLHWQNEEFLKLLADMTSRRREMKAAKEAAKAQREKKRKRSNRPSGKQVLGSQGKLEPFPKPKGDAKAQKEETITALPVGKIPVINVRRPEPHPTWKAGKGKRSA